jgi:hypothetical protein
MSNAYKTSKINKQTTKHTQHLHTFQLNKTTNAARNVSTIKWSSSGETSFSVNFVSLHSLKCFHMVKLTCLHDLSQTVNPIRIKNRLYQK